MEKDHVVLAVVDQGKGIKPEVLDKLGTPFFSTKDNGTGLGLGVCYAIAARHHAKIEIQTGTRGTTFFVKFRTVTREEGSSVKKMTEEPSPCIHNLRKGVFRHDCY